MKSHSPSWLTVALCSVLDHRWNFYMVSGDHGEPAEDECLRCRERRIKQGLCRCLIPCCCQIVTFVSGVDEARER